VTAASTPIHDSRGTAVALSPWPMVKPLAKMPTAKSSGTCNAAEIARVTGVITSMIALENAVISLASGSTQPLG
jgi:hypothetical protein